MMGTATHKPEKRTLPRLIPSAETTSPLPLIRLLAQIAARQSVQGNGGTQC